MLEQHESRLPSPRELKAQIDAERTGLPFVFWRDAAGAQHIIMLAPDRMKNYPEDLRKWVVDSKPDADKLYKDIKAKK